MLLCSGKIYFDLAQHRRELGRDDIAIVRVEQLAPLPFEQLRTVLTGYPDGTPVVWVQEEPENMGFGVICGRVSASDCLIACRLRALPAGLRPVRLRVLPAPTSANRPNWSSRPSEAFDGRPPTA